MGLGRQAKVLTKGQVDAVFSYLGNGRHGLRDQVIFLLSVRAGLRAKEIAALRWSMVVTPEGQISDHINLTDAASKGRSGRSIPICRQLKIHLASLLSKRCINDLSFNLMTSYLVTTERGDHTTSQVIVNKFHVWYSSMGLLGCSSHSGRRTFITNAARKINLVGGSLRDVQSLAGHSSLQVTQRYIEISEDARRKIVEII